MLDLEGLLRKIMLVNAVARQKKVMGTSTPITADSAMKVGEIAQNSEETTTAISWLEGVVTQSLAIRLTK
jgi:hypothetical protein